MVVEHLLILGKTLRSNGPSFVKCSSVVDVEILKEHIAIQDIAI